MATTEVESGSDVLAFAPRPVNRRLLLALVLLLVLALLAGAGIVVWQRLRPPPDFTLVQLQGAYTGMVRSDGTNDVSTIDPSKFTDPPLSFTPPTCAALFDTTVSNQWAAGGLDGVSTYWLNQGSASISLFTVRYPDDDAAAAAYQRVVDARPACEGQGSSITFVAPASLDRRLPESGGTLHDVPVVTGKRTHDQVAYRLERAASQGRYVVHLLRLSNTVSWQYRYDSGTGAYDNTADQQLMDGLATQLLSVQDAPKTG
ncbi:sensor domain-containing protein [uncultured Friedmanniella sp.]|uniref:sensor domain-containing protein n=1 Tax=uncultured Friedmanniella sp. TaxID=335381 RepID=UPI0035CC3CC9